MYNGNGEGESAIREEYTMSSISKTEYSSLCFFAKLEHHTFPEAVVLLLCKHNDGLSVLTELTQAAKHNLGVGSGLTF